MPDITITLPIPLNHSVQEGDIAYYIDADQTVGGFQTHVESEPIIQIGPIKTITLGDTTATLVCDMPNGTVAPVIGNFIFFGKDRGVNESSILGYYGEFKFINDSRQKAELFSTACEVAENSK